MTFEEYLKSVLQDQTIEPDSDEMASLEASRKEIVDLITSSFSWSSCSIRYAGSKAKGTMIKTSYDLDIACYFNHDSNDAGESLQEIYDNIANLLQSSYIVERKNSAIRIIGSDDKLDYHIDVVPGRFVDDTKTYAYLHQSNGKKDRLKTNLDIHISHIKDSGLADVVRLVKLWNTHTGLSIKTFVLELMVVKYATKSQETPLSAGFQSFLKYMSEHSKDIHVEDPANPEGNDLSDYLDNTLKSILGNQASFALANIKEGNLQGVFSLTNDFMSSEEKVQELNRLITILPSTPKPWSF